MKRGCNILKIAYSRTQIGKYNNYTRKKECKMKKILINEIQADIIFKALHYAATSEGLAVDDDIQKSFEFLAERNANETYIENTIEVMEYLNTFIKESETYTEWIEESM